jgi:hypothetical protein
LDRNMKPARRGGEKAAEKKIKMEKRKRRQKLRSWEKERLYKGVGYFSGKGVTTGGIKKEMPSQRAEDLEEKERKLNVRLRVHEQNSCRDMWAPVQARDSWGAGQGNQSVFF